ncbi:MAG: cbb3-type cytochrome oxidase subunit 3 [Actinomycetota bacterium]
MLAQIVDNFLRPFWIVWVIALFCGIVFYAYRPKNKQRLEEYGNIPLKDDK